MTAAARAHHPPTRSKPRRTAEQAALISQIEQVAQGLIDLFDAGAGDGFNIIPPFMPGGLGDFVQ